MPDSKADPTKWSSPRSFHATMTTLKQALTPERNVAVDKSMHVAFFILIHDYVLCVITNPKVTSDWYNSYPQPDFYESLILRFWTGPGVVNQLVQLKWIWNNSKDTNLIFFFIKGNSNPILHYSEWLSTLFSPYLFLIPYTFPFVVSSNEFASHKITLSLLASSFFTTERVVISTLIYFTYILPWSFISDYKRQLLLPLSMLIGTKLPYFKINLQSLHPFLVFILPLTISYLRIYRSIILSHHMMGINKVQRKTIFPRKLGDYPFLTVNRILRCKYMPNQF